MGIKNLVKGVGQMVSDLWGGTTVRTVMSTYRARTYDLLRKEYDIALSLYAGRHVGILAQDVALTFKPREAEDLMRQPMIFNLLRRVIDKRAMLYKESPEFDCKCQPLVDAIDDDFASGLKQGDRISELCGLCWMGAVWDERGGKLFPLAVPPDQAVPVWSPIVPGRLDGLDIYTFSLDLDGRQNALRTSWTRDNFVIYKGVGGGGWKDATDEVLEAMGEAPNPDRVNPYGLIPYSPMRPTLTLYGDPMGNPDEALIWLQRTLNQKLTELQYLLKMQAHSQLVLTGNWPDNITVGVGDPIVAQPAGDGSASTAEYISPSARISELWDTIRQLTQYAAFLNSIGGQWPDGGSIPSGEALKVLNSDLEELRKDKESAHRLFWRDYANVLEAVRAYGQGGSPSDVSDFQVSFGTEKVYEDPLALAQKWQAEIDLDLTTPWRVLMEMEPDLSEEDAKARVQQNAEDNAALQKIGAPAPPPASAFLGMGAAMPKGKKPQGDVTQVEENPMPSGDMNMDMGGE